MSLIYSCVFPAATITVRRVTKEKQTTVRAATSITHSPPSTHVHSTRRAPMACSRQLSLGTASRVTKTATHVTVHPISTVLPVPLAGMTSLKRHSSTAYQGLSVTPHVFQVPQRRFVHSGLWCWIFPSHG